MRRFLVGDGVRLKGDPNSPRMTITAWASLTQEYRCSWFDGSRLRTLFFKENALEPVP